MKFEEELKQYEEEYLYDIIKWILIREKDEQSDFGKIADLITNPKSSQGIALAKKLITFFEETEELIKDVRAQTWINPLDSTFRYYNDKSKLTEKDLAIITYLRLASDAARRNTKSFKIIKKIKLPTSNYDIIQFMDEFHELYSLGKEKQKEIKK